jgi:hypothetical protein
VTVLGLGACGGETPQPEAPKAEAQPDDAPRRVALPSIESEVGALDQSKVKAAFQRSQDRLMACYTKGAQRLAYLSGEVKFFVRVGRDGSARRAYLEESNLGDRDTERCMIEVLKGVTWPRPEGGEGEARNVLSFAPGEDERMPVVWSVEQLGAPYKSARAKLQQCRKKANAKPMKATFYVETDGKPAAVGVAVTDEHGEEAVDCVVSALSSVKFPSPGSFASKVTVTIE